MRSRPNAISICARATDVGRAAGPGETGQRVQTAHVLPARVLRRGRAQGTRILGRAQRRRESDGRVPRVPAAARRGVQHRDGIPAVFRVAVRARPRPTSVVRQPVQSTSRALFIRSSCTVDVANCSRTVFRKVDGAIRYGNDWRISSWTRPSARRSCWCLEKTRESENPRKTNSKRCTTNTGR